jgi:GrpB-like predicted nucleotidyltransferase (UPF0157 family)
MGQMSDEALPAQTHETTEEEMRAATIGPLQPLNGPVLIVDYNPEWPRQFDAEAA